jgi:hypothetical protein
VITHDGSKPTNRCFDRDPQPPVTAASLTTAVCCSAGRLGRTVPDVGLQTPAMPDTWLPKAREVTAIEDPSWLWSLQELAVELGVHVRTLRDAEGPSPALRKGT